MFVIPQRMPDVCGAEVSLHPLSKAIMWTVRAGPHAYRRHKQSAVRPWFDSGV